MIFITHDGHNQDCGMSAMYLQEARIERVKQDWHRYVHGRTLLPSLGIVHQLTFVIQAYQHSNQPSARFC